MRPLSAAFLGVLALALLCLWSPQASRAAGPITVPQGFQDTVAIEGLTEPTQLGIAPDERVFVAEKSGIVRVYDNFDDQTPTVFADLRTKVFNAYDRGLLGLAVDPEFPTRPYVYVLYTYNHQLGDKAAPPKWPETSPGSGYEECPEPPGADTDGCVVSGRLARLTVAGDQASAETVLIEDWCQQFSTHSVGEIRFDSSGALYATGGEGAGFLYADYGQAGIPKNPCGDPPTGVGGEQEPPTAEGGALRAQDVRTTADPTALSGTMIRIDPDTGKGLAGNPFFATPGADENEKRIVAFGFRNPFRFTIDSETHEAYVGNVGWNTWEEIDRFNATPSQAHNSGWPCYEGPSPQFEYDILDLSLCESLYSTVGGVSAPFFYYPHAGNVVPGDSCPNVEGSAVAGMAVYRDDAFPEPYDGALLFADPVRSCIYAMFPGPDGRPDPSTITPFLHGGLYPGIDIEIGPEGDLYYVTLFSGEYEEGQVHRISYFSGNEPPVADLSVDNQWGSKPLTVNFDAGGSTDGDGDSLTYEWDFENDGTFEAPTTDATDSRIYNDSVNHTVAVRVSDPSDAKSIARVTVYPDDLAPPVPNIVQPTASFTWSVGELIAFQGGATDSQDGSLPSTSLDWSARVAHCPVDATGCHTHQLPAFPAVSSGSFAAPDHDYPSHILLTLKATDSRGLSKTISVQLEPETAKLTLASNPVGLTLSGGQATGAAPLSLTVIKGSQIGISAPLTQQMGGATYTWDHWSDGLGRNHTITATASATYEAFYSKSEEPGPGPTTPTEPPPTEKPPLVLPETSLGKRPPKRTKGRTATFTFSSSKAGSVFRCSLDGAPFKACRSPKGYKGLKPKGHIFKVIALDGDGNADPTPMVFRWKVVR